MNADRLERLGIGPERWAEIMRMSCLDAAAAVGGLALVVETEDHLRGDPIERACREVIARTRRYRRLGCDPHWSNRLTLECAVMEAS